MKSLSSLLLIVVLNCDPLIVHAEIVLFDQSVPPMNGAVVTMSDFESGIFTGDDFTLATDSVVRKVTWSGAYVQGGGPPTTDIFTIAFFQPTAPNSTPIFSYSVGNNVSRIDSGFLLVGGGPSLAPLFTFTADIPDTNLASGTYLLSIYNDTRSEPEGNFGWIRNINPIDNTLSQLGYVRNSPASAWVAAPSINSSFALIGTAVPEPSSMFLLTLSGFSILIRRRIRR